MSDDRERLDEVLRDKASEVPQFQELPEKTAKRAKRRVGRNVASSVIVAGFILIAVSLGVSNLHKPAQVVPGGSTDTGTPTVPGAMCDFANLAAKGNLQGAAGSVEGSIDLTNVGSSSCSLTGRPTVSFQTAAGDPVTGDPITAEDGAPWWKKDGASPPPGWPVVTLDPGSSAAVSIRWSNQCPQIDGAVVWTISDGTSSVQVDPSTTSLVPPCNGSGEPTTLEVGPYEPAPTGQ
jgi:hypothetical protein